MRALLVIFAALALAGCATTDPESSGTTTTTPASGTTTTTTTTPAGTTTTTTVATTTTTPPTVTTPDDGGDATPVAIQGFAFVPATVTIRAGEAVNWTNMDSAAHTATADDGSFDSSTLSKGRSFERVFPAAGTFEYECAFHSSMRGTVVVE